MEKYFMVTEENILHKDWFDYKNNSKAVRELVREFFESHGIGATEYYVTDDEIHIVPNESDTEAFGSLLCAPIENGLQKFKKSSAISKAWVRALQDAGLKVLRRPMLILYFRSFGGGRFRSRIFDQNGILYCSIDPVVGEAPKGLVEIKASEFYKIIEEAEAATA
ncbi:hypothetical protein D3C76_662560 [compost metagenome]